MKRSSLLLAAIAVMAISYNSAAQDSSGISRVARMYNYWDWTNSVVVQGNFAYLAAYSSGLQIVDISDLESLEIVGFYDDMPGYAVAVAVSGDYAYIAAGEQGLFILDVSNPNQPFLVGSIDTPDYTAKIIIKEDYVYTVDRRAGLRVIDVSDKAAPEELGTIELEGWAQDLTLSDNYAYVANWFGGLHIVDINDPENPRLAGSFEGGRWTNGVAVVGELSYLTGVPDLRILDVSNPEDIQVVGTFRASGSGEGRAIGVKDDYAYIANNSTEPFPPFTFKALTVVDISDPREPSEAGYYSPTDRNAGDITAMTLIEELIFVTTAGSDPLRIVDISDDEEPQEIGFIAHQSGRLWKVALSGNLALTSYPEFAFRILDITDLSDPDEVYVSDSLGFIGIETDGNLAFMTNGADFIVMDITDPAHPITIGVLEGIYAYGDPVIAEDYAYLHGMLGDLYIVDISDPSEPYTAGTHFIAGHLEPNLAVEGNYVFYAAFIRGLFVLDISDLDSIVEVGHIDIHEGSVHDIAVMDDYAYLAVDGGVHVINIADPSRPALAGIYETYGWTEKIVIIGNVAFVAGDRLGLIILDLTDPTHPEEIGFYRTSGRALDLGFTRNHAVVADLTNLSIYDCSEVLGVQDDPFILHPSSFILYPAYPNPFNSTTQIEYSLPYRSEAALRLYDLSGRSVMDIFQGIQPPGVHAVTLSATDLPSGLYFIRMEAAEKVFTRKVMLIR